MQIGRETDIQTDRQGDIQKDRPTDRRADGHNKNVLGLLILKN